MTYRVQEVKNRRRRIVVHFNQYTRDTTIHQQSRSEEPLQGVKTLVRCQSGGGRSTMRACNKRFLPVHAQGRQMGTEEVAGIQNNCPRTDVLLDESTDHRIDIPECEDPFLKRGNCVVVCNLILCCLSKVMVSLTEVR